MTRTQPDSSKPSRLPADVRALFWDIDRRGLSWRRDRQMIIDRILSHGGWRSIVWLRGMTTPAELRDWFFKTKGRSLDPPKLRFWELKLGLPHRLVNEWIADMKRNPWHRRHR